MTETFIEKYSKKKVIEERNNEILFGLIGGTLLSSGGFLKFLTSEGPLMYGCIVVCVLGICVFLVAIIVPSVLKYPCKAFLFLGNKTGTIVFTVVLTVVYSVLILPVGLLLRNRRQRYGFYCWEGSFCEDETAFETLKTHKSTESGFTRSSFLWSLYRVFGTVTHNKRYFLIPAIIILVLAGAILFFVSSNVVVYFVYPLF